jgi:periplasmic divalent cation tolerance protein
VSDYVVVSCATGSRESADEIATALVERRFAACVQIMPIASVYRWQGRVEREAEHVLQIKTTAQRVAEVEACIAALHPYELPEITVVRLGGGSAAYFAWIDAAVAPEPAVAAATAPILVDGEGGPMVEFRGYVRDH